MNIVIVEFGLCELSRLMEYMFSFIFGQFCDKKKTCAFVVIGIGKRVVWAAGGMGRNN